MKTTKWFLGIGCLIVMMLGLSSSAEGVSEYGAKHRQTSGDIKMAGYAAWMRRDFSPSAAEVRSNDYRRLYEYCNRHHDCYNLTSGQKSEAK